MFILEKIIQIPLKLINFLNNIENISDQNNSLDALVSVKNSHTYEKGKQTQEIDIYDILGQDPNDNKQQGKAKYRQKISEKMTIYQRKQLALASQILIRNEFYNKGVIPKEGKRKYKFNEDIFHYATTCDFIKLIKTLQQEPKKINMVDENKNSLLYLAAQPGFVALVRYLLTKNIDINQQNKFGSTALHAASFYGHFQIVKLLLLNGADFKIKNNMGNLPIDEAKNDEIKTYFQNHEKNQQSHKIFQEINNLRDQQLITLVTELYDNDILVDNKPIFIGFFLNINYQINKKELKKLLEKQKDPKKWINAYHGTKSQYAASIIKNGFMKPSKREQSPQSDHYGLDITINDIKNWADACFFSQSMYMACKPTYSEPIHQSIIKNSSVQNINCDENYYGDFQFIFQVNLKENGYLGFNHTLKNYNKQDDEPDELEWRVEDENNILITGIYYLRSDIQQQYNSHLKLREKCNENERMYGIQANKINSVLKERKDVYDICYLGHTLKKFFDNETICCDTCNKQEKIIRYCQACEFARCSNCIKNKILI